MNYPKYTARVAANVTTNLTISLAVSAIVVTVLSALSGLSVAAVVDTSQCSLAKSSFALVTQSEGPTKACGGLGEAEPDAGVGNPINVMNGNKYEQAVDLPELPAYPGLSLSRHYNSQARRDLPMGFGWYHNWNIRLYDTGQAIQIREGTGRSVIFRPQRVSLPNGQYEIRGVSANLSEGWVQQTLDRRQWLWHRGERVYAFERPQTTAQAPLAEGLALLRRIRPEMATPKGNSQAGKPQPGEMLDLHYTPQHELLSVTNGQGNRLLFSYQQTRFGLPQVRVQTPMGEFQYFLDKQHNLREVLQPDGRRTRYSYDARWQGGDVHNLTGKAEYDRDTHTFRPVSEWHYDTQDRAILSQHPGGVERISLQFDPAAPLGNRTDLRVLGESHRPFTTILTNSLGQTTRYQWQLHGTDYRLLDVRGAGCASCGQVNRRYAYTPEGLIAEVSDLDRQGEPLHRVQYDYTPEGQLSVRIESARDVETRITRYHYEPVQLAATVTQPAQTVQRLSSIDTDSVLPGKSHRWLYRYNPAGQTIAVTETGFSPLGETLTRTTSYGYDPQGRLWWENGPLPDGPTHSVNDSDITVYGYDEASPTTRASSGTGQIAWWRKGNGFGGVQTTQVRYDSQGLPARFSRIAEAVNQPAQLERLDVRYDNHFRMKPSELVRWSSTGSTPIEQAGGLRYHYTSSGQLSVLNDLNGQLLKANAYDDAQRLIAWIDRQQGYVRVSRTTENQIDYRQQLTAAAHGQFAWTETGYRYDPWGQLSAIADRQQGLLSKIDYADDGVSGRITDAHGNAQWLQYDALGRLRTRWRVPANGFRAIPKRTRTLYTLGSVEIQLHDGTHARNEYDDFGRLSRQLTSALGENRIHYNAWGLPDQRLQAEGTRLSYVYDELGRVRREVRQLPATQHHSATLQITRFSYQGNHLASVDDGLQVTQYHYDADGRLLEREIRYRGLPRAFVTHYDYDASGQPLKMTLADGLILTAKKQGIQASRDGDWHSEPVLTAETTDAEDSIPAQTRYRLGNGVRLDFNYTPAGVWRGLHYTRSRPESWNLLPTAHAETELTLLSQTWQYDSEHRLQDLYSSVDTAPIAALSTDGLNRHEHYHYDAYNHLIIHDQNTLSAPLTPKTAPVSTVAAIIPKSSAEPPSGDVSGSTPDYYLYDIMGNRLGSRIEGHSQEAPETSNLPAPALPTRYQTAKGQLTLAYDRGQISEVSLNGQPVASYRYNYLGQRVLKIVYHDAQQRRLSVPKLTYFVYDGQQLVHEANALGNITRTYLYLSSGGVERPLATVDYNGQGQPPSTPVQSWFKRFIRQVSFRNGVTAHWHYVVTDYMARPRVVTDDQQRMVWRDDGRDAFGASEIRGKHYVMNVRHAGQYEDEETGLYYNHYRYYDPSTGRYTTPDPLGLRGGENLYGYVNQQPNQYNDPQGLLLFAFDGTGNTDYQAYSPNLIHNGYDNRMSNVTKFRDSYLGSKGELNVNSKVWFNQHKNFSYNTNNAFYISGAGTEDQYTFIGRDPSESNFGGLDAGLGLSLPNRVDQMLIYFSEYVSDIITQRKSNKQKESNQTIDVDVIGFSRGAASARMFASKLDFLLNSSFTNGDALLNPNWSKENLEDNLKLKKRYWGNINYNNLKCLGINVNMRFLGLWDTVPALGLSADDDITYSKILNMNLQVGNAFNYVAQAVAVNEHRENFAVRSIFNSKLDAIKYAASENDPKKKPVKIRIEKGFMGAHSDIGGGYNEGDISNVALMWMIDQAKKSGVKFDDKYIASHKFNMVEHPIIHDSVGDVKAGNDDGTAALALMQPGRNFLWANDDNMNNHVNQHLTGMDDIEYGYNDKISKSTTKVNHLGLNWKDTLEFEKPESNTKFEDAFEYEKMYQFMKNMNNSCTSSGLACKPILNYQALKVKGVTADGKSREGSQTIIINDVDDISIDIKGYLKWILQNYGTEVSVKK